MAEVKVICLALFAWCLLFVATTPVSVQGQLNLYNVTTVTCTPTSSMQYFNLTVSFWPENTPAESMVVMFRLVSGFSPQWTAYASTTAQHPSKQSNNWTIQADTASNSLGGEIWIPKQPIGTVIYLSYDCSMTSNPFNFTIEPVIPTYVFQSSTTNYFSASIQDSGVHANWFAFNSSVFVNDNFGTFAMRTELCTPPNSNTYQASTRIVFPGVSKTASCDVSNNGFIDSMSNWNVNWYVGQNLQTNDYLGVFYIYVVVTQYNTNYQLVNIPSYYSIIIAGSIDNWDGSGANPWGVLASPPDWNPLQINNDLYLIPSSISLFPWETDIVTVYYSTSQSSTFNPMWMGSLCYLQTNPSEVSVYNGTFLNSVSDPLRFNNFGGVIAPGFFNQVKFASNSTPKIAFGISEAGLVPLPPYWGYVTSLQLSKFDTTTTVVIAGLAGLAAALLATTIIFYFKYAKERQQYLQV